MGMQFLPSLVHLPCISDPLGTLGVIEGPSILPFDVKRAYFIQGIPAGSVRGSHAHKELQQLIFAPSGSFDLILDDGVKLFEFRLESQSVAVVVPPGYWRTLQNFSSDAVCMVLASAMYDESDYIRDYQEFLNWKIE